MSTFSIRLPHELEQRLNEEIKRSHKNRSEVVREAVADYVARRARERFLTEMVAEAKALYSDETARRETLELAEDAIATGNEALDIAESRTPGEPWPEESGEKWWR